ncbi:MAG TPA: NAD(P)/FAD-dependent oxidoreductase, partial [Caulobacteraceae bacterium]|nr:NAD(P)/FAD-dependent oxidoreductase [Caulobacteraceae bacterium]
MADSAGSPGANFDVVIVGAGFSGLYMLHRLRKLGLSARVYEAGAGVGGTWFWNRYPGARVDIESMEYSYSFSDDLADDWHWSERYASQPELLKYLNHVADRFELRRDIQLNTRVSAASFDETALRWDLALQDGTRVSARFVVMATGCLSIPKAPDFPGVEAFRGPTYQTSSWPHEGVDFAGMRVGVIGTGSSAIQAIPVIAAQASHLTVFQRTPNFSVPAHNGPVDPALVQEWKDNRTQYRADARNAGFGIRMIEQSEQPAAEASPAEHDATYQKRWERGGFALLGAYADLITDKAANDTAVKFVSQKIREIVKDPEVAERLTPKTYPIGTKRICVDTGYYDTYNRAN